MPFILLFMLLFSSSVHSSRLLHSERRCLVFILLFMFGVSFSFSLTLLANVDVFVRRSANKRKFRQSGYGQRTYHRVSRSLAIRNSQSAG